MCERVCVCVWMMSCNDWTESRFARQLEYRVLHKFEETKKWKIIKNLLHSVVVSGQGDIREKVFRSHPKLPERNVRSTQNCGGLLLGQQSLLNKHDHTNLPKGQTWGLTSVKPRPDQGLSLIGIWPQIWGWTRGRPRKIGELHKLTIKSDQS
jgi:hypothetical protein